eukprot:264353_1
MGSTTNHHKSSITNNHNSNGTCTLPFGISVTNDDHQKHDSPIPNAMAIDSQHNDNNNKPSNKHNRIDLIDSDSPTTNTPDIAMKDIQSSSPNNAQSRHMPCGIIKRNVDHESTTYDYLSIYTDKRCLIHAIPDTTIIEEFNERPARLQALLDMIDDQHWNTCCRFIPSLTSVPSLQDIEGLHSKEYLSDLKNSCNKIYSGNWNVPPHSDTYIVKETFDAALVSAGLVIEATKHVFSHIPPLPFPQEIKDAMDVDDNADAHNNDNTNKPVLQTETTEVIDETSTKKYAVVLNRPPGHHCDGEKYSGYCFINSTAVAIEKQLNEDTRVLVLDIDVHHGDGTQKLFYTEPTVLAVSFHQYDGSFFPVSGLRTEYGPSRRHAAYGTNVNVPLGHGASDLDVLYALRSMVWNIVEKFKPDIAFYAVGTDGVAGDKANAATIFTPSLYGQVAYELRKYVDLIVVTTEGGYTTDYLSSGMSAVLHGLTGQIDTEYYPSELNENDILATTVHTVAATTSDLRRVYDFEQDPHEISKIFNKGGRLSQSVEANGESMYCPNDEDEQDGDYMQNETYFDDEEDDEFFKELTKQRKNEKHKK